MNDGSKPFVERPKSGTISMSGQFDADALPAEMISDDNPTPMVFCPVKRGGWLSWLVPQRIYTGKCRLESYDFKIEGDTARTEVTLVPVGPVSREWRLFFGAFGTGGFRVWPLWRKAR